MPSFFPYVENKSIFIPHIVFGKTKYPSCEVEFLHACKEKKQFQSLFHHHANEHCSLRSMGFMSTGYAMSCKKQSVDILWDKTSIKD